MAAWALPLLVCGGSFSAMLTGAALVWVFLSGIITVLLVLPEGPCSCSCLCNIRLSVYAPLYRAHEKNIIVGYFKIYIVVYL